MACIILSGEAWIPPQKNPQTVSFIFTVIGFHCLPVFVCSRLSLTYRKWEPWIEDKNSKAKNWKVKIGIQISISIFHENCYKILIFVSLVPTKIENQYFIFNFHCPWNWKSKLDFRFSNLWKQGWYSSTPILHLHLDMQMPDLCSNNIVVFSSQQPPHTN